jgi:hypothetical protein
MKVSRAMNEDGVDAQHSELDDDVSLRLIKMLLSVCVALLDACERATSRASKHPKPLDTLIHPRRSISAHQLYEMLALTTSWCAHDVLAIAST